MKLFSHAAGPVARGSGGRRRPRRSISAATSPATRAFSSIRTCRRGWESMQRGDRDRALAELERARRLAPDNATVALQLAAAYRKFGERRARRVRASRADRPHPWRRAAGDSVGGAVDDFDTARGPHRPSSHRPSRSVPARAPASPPRRGQRAVPPRTGTFRASRTTGADVQRPTPAQRGARLQPGPRRRIASTTRTGQAEAWLAHDERRCGAAGHADVQARRRWCDRAGDSRVAADVSRSPTAAPTRTGHAVAAAHSADRAAARRPDR